MFSGDALLTDKDGNVIPPDPGLAVNRAQASASAEMITARHSRLLLPGHGAPAPGLAKASESCAGMNANPEADVTADTGRSPLATGAGGGQAGKRYVKRMEASSTDEESPMKKPTVTWVWLSGLAAIIAGFIVVATGIGLMLGLGGVWTQTGASSYHFAPRLDSFFWGMVSIIAVGGVVILAGLVMQFVAWIGATINTWRSSDKTWFLLLLVLGVLGFQFIMMIVYLIAGPDVTYPRPPSMAYPPPAPPQGMRVA